MHRIGAHVSIVGGHVAALEKAAAMGCSAMQCFSASPQAWNFARIEDEYIAQFVKRKNELGINDCYFHASYLVNFADTNRIGPLSIKLITHELKLASQMGIKGSIIHLGSYKTNGNDKSHLYENIRAVLDRIPPDVYFIVENSGTRKIGLRLEEIGDIVTEINDPRLKVCLDTCHLHAAGYTLQTAEAFEEFLKEVDATIGYENVEVWHINDSKDLLGSFRDRHENLGYGYVGTDVFKHILNHPVTKNTAMLLEVPGFDKQGPDKQNMDIFKAWITSEKVQ